MKYVTRGSKEVWGFSAKAVLKNNQLVWNQIEAGGDFEKVQESIMESIQSKSKWTASWKYVMPSGEIRTHLGYGSPYFLPDGTVSFNSVILDITQEAKNEALLEQATEMAKIGSWELDMINQNGDAMYWSPMTREILEVDELYNPSLTGGFEFYTESSKQRIEKAVDVLIEEGREFDEELLTITGNGNEKWIRCIGKSDRVKNKCVKIYGSFQDIHASKSLENQIREILGSISDAFYALDKDWNFTYFNKEAENLLHKKVEEVLGKCIWEAFPSALGTHLEKVYYQVARNGQPESFEYLRKTDEKWYEINVYPFNDGVSVFFKNIHERKQSAEKLKKAFEEKNNILESIGDAFFTVDGNWVVTYWNNIAEQLVDLKRGDIIGKNLWEEFPDAKNLEFGSQFQKAMDTGQTVTFIEYYPGLEKWLELSAYPSTGSLSVFFRDITERKNFEKQLLELNESLKKYTHELELSNEQLEQFAFIASHDLQEPLRMITSFLDQLKRKYRNQLDEKALQYIYFATDGAKRMKQIILDLLEYSRAGRLEESLEKIDLNALLQDYQLLRKRLITEKGVDLNISQLPVVNCYKSPMIQTLHCLLDNAIKYSNPEVAPCINIKSEEKENFWKISIADNGIGIEPQFYEKIFVIFQRLHNKNEYEGTGIGLSIAKKHVEFWGGKIWLESTPGEGSTFYFTIPKD